MVLAAMLAACLVVTPARSEEASAGSKVCAVAADFSGATVIADQGDRTCSVSAASLVGFTPNKTSCAEMISAEHGYTKAMQIGSMQVCCGGKAGACAEFATQVCKNKADFKPAAKIDGETACVMMVGMVPAFDPSEAACAKDTKMGDSSMKLSQVSAYMAGDCCGGKPTVCDEYAAQICASKADFKTSGTFDWKNETGTSCSMGRAMLDTFVASKTTCAETIEMDKDTIVRSEALKNMTKGCCKNQGVCEPFDSDSNKTTSAAFGVGATAAAFARSLRLIGATAAAFAVGSW